MLLAIDAGNTNVVFAVYDGKDLRGEWRIATDQRRTADEYAVWLLQLMAMSGLEKKDVTAAIYASVVPAANFHFARLCTHHFGCAPMEVGSPDVDLGIEVLMDNPGEVGADRLVNAVAVAQTHNPPLIVIDFGTATTFDFIDADGNYCGGIIAPGINLSMDALHHAAAKLPKVEVMKTDRIIGKGTVQAMQSGVFWGYVGLIEGLVSRAKQEFGAPMTVVATGGLAGQFADATDVIEAIDGEMTMRGLLHIYNRNNNK